MEFGSQPSESRVVLDRPPTPRTPDFSQQEVPPPAYTDDHILVGKHMEGDNISRRREGASPYSRTPSHQSKSVLTPQTHPDMPLM